MDKLRVLHVIQDLTSGGLERIAAEITANLDRNRFEAELWCLSGGGPLEEILEGRVPVKKFNYLRYLLPGNIYALAKLIKAGCFSVVHTHSYAPGVVGRISARLAGVPIIIHHHHSVSAASMNFRMRFAERFVTRDFTDRVIASSEATERFITSNNFARKEKITVIHNGVPTEFELPSENSDALKTELGINRERVLVSVGSLTAHKGHIHLLKAVKIVTDIFPDLKLVIVGEGPERHNLERFISENALSKKLILAGARKDVRPYLELADIFVLPSIVESMSISTAEAMSKELPVIASRTGGVPEVVREGETGFLVEPANPHELAEKIVLLLKDPGAAISMGKKGYMRYKEFFTLPRMIDKIQNLYLGELSAKQK